MRRVVPVLLAAVVLALAACGGHGRAVTTEPLSYRSGGSTVQAYLVARLGVHGPRPGVVVVHGSGGDRRELLPRARELARDGALVLVPTMPSSTPPALRPTTVPELLAQARAAQDADVLAVRRGADLLRARGARALGYLGWSSGAKTGALVAARDRRFTALALLSAGAETLDAFAAAAPPGSAAEVTRVLGSVDPIAAIRRARPGTVLLEDGTHDEIVPRRALENVVRAAPPRTTVRWYDAPHALDDRAYRDAERWLFARLQ